MNLAGQRWRFRVHTQAACRVVRWRIRTSMLRLGSITVEQFPELCWEIGEHVVEWVGPNDLQVMALVTVQRDGVALGEMPLVFQRERA